MALERLHDRVNMIRHYAPGMQGVPLSMEVKKRVLHRLGIFRVREGAASVSFGECSFDLLAEEPVILLTERFCADRSTRVQLCKAFPFKRNFLLNLAWQRIRQ